MNFDEIKNFISEKLLELQREGETKRRDLVAILMLYQLRICSSC